LREASGITREAAGYTIRASSSKISRLELGRVASKERDVADLLTLYGVTDAEERETLLILARQANAPGWWHRYGDVLPNWFETYLGLEQAASVIRTYEPQLVPGLLQDRGQISDRGMLGTPEHDLILGGVGHREGQRAGFGHGRHPPGAGQGQQRATRSQGVTAGAPRAGAG